MSGQQNRICEECGTSERYKNGRCVECKRRYNARYREKHKDRINSLVRKWRKNNPHYHRNWARDNPGVLRRNHKSWVEKNKEYDRQRKRRWFKENADKNRIYSHQYRARKANAEGEFTAEEFKRLCDRYDNKCLRCGRGDINLTPDHVVPLSRGGANHIGNIQPLCKPCNSSKRDKIKDYRNRGTVRRWIQRKLFS